MNESKLDTFVDLGCEHWVECVVRQERWTYRTLNNSNVVGLVRSYLTYVTRDEVLWHARQIIECRELKMDRKPLPLWRTLEPIVTALHTNNGADHVVVDLKEARLRRVGKSVLCHVLALAEQRVGQHHVTFVSSGRRTLADHKEKVDKLRTDKSPLGRIEYVLPFSIVTTPPRTGIIIEDEAIATTVVFGRQR